MSDKRSVLGKAGETLAAEHLRQSGYTILERNYRSRSGEIDIIARQGKTLVFAEVKTRKSASFGSPSAAVTLKKQAQISRVAQEYLARENLFDKPARFDVVAVFAPDGRKPEIEIITNAFELHYSVAS
ncbi:YraN family protein [Desulfopila aestuarii]|uniref:UPF0102 protein SAMN02745220_03801 n=1 Tax=Desulfopila aestuarii DSM 18488 TaxID=1121416 RepID=A0A1M7YEI4_9BACT|nr:YraN family protein [Desulfopila aestuarii]SHO51054.1 putative endonuclease [Desulfopila aestuarii DSM 18488]